MRTHINMPSCTPSATTQNEHPHQCARTSSSTHHRRVHDERSCPNQQALREDVRPATKHDVQQSEPVTGARYCTHPTQQEPIKVAASAASDTSMYNFESADRVSIPVASSLHLQDVHSETEVPHRNRRSLGVIPVEKLVCSTRRVSTRLRDGSCVRTCCKPAECTVDTEYTHGDADPELGRHT